MMPLQAGDVPATYAEDLGYKPATPIQEVRRLVFRYNKNLEGKSFLMNKICVIGLGYVGLMHFLQNMR